MKKISIVVPCYNEAENIVAFREAVSKVFESLSYTLEFVFVNDGSIDATQECIQTLTKEDSRVKYIEFVRNYGQQAATTTGITHATGDAVMIMDVDLQHPPRLIPEFIRLWEEGSDTVFGVRRRRAGESFFRSVTSKIAGALISIGEGRVLPHNTSDFSIMDRSVVDGFKKLPPRRVMTRFQIARAAKKLTFITFDVADRMAGESKYTFAKLLKLLWKSTFGKSVGTLQHYEIRHTNIHD